MYCKAIFAGAVLSATLAAAAVIPIAAQAKPSGKPESLSMQVGQLPFRIEVPSHNGAYGSSGNSYTVLFDVKGSCKKGSRITDVRSYMGRPNGDLMEHASYAGLTELWKHAPRDHRTFKSARVAKSMASSKVYFAGLKSAKAYCEHKRAELQGKGWSKSAIFGKDWTYTINQPLSTVMGCRRKGNGSPKPWEIGRRLDKLSLPVKVVCKAQS